MATRFGITLPNNVKLTLIYDKDQSKVDLLDKMVQEPWADYCLRNWMNDSPESYKAPENRVKRLLDRCGTLLLRDVPRDERNTLSDYKEVMNDKREISLSDCPCGASFMINDDGEQALSGEHWGRARYEAMLERVDARAKPYEKKDREAKKEQKRARQTTKFSRIADIETKHPGCTCAGYRVDTDNEFDVCGIRYRISPTCEKYAPHHTRYGDQYDMDRVLVFTCPDGRLIFADQDGYLIDDGQIEQLNG